MKNLIPVVILVLLSHSSFAEEAKNSDRIKARLQCVEKLIQGELALGQYSDLDVTEVIDHWYLSAFKFYAKDDKDNRFKGYIYASYSEKAPEVDRRSGRPVSDIWTVKCWETRYSRDTPAGFTPEYGFELYNQVGTLIYVSYPSRY